jgi:translation initiation factor 1A
MSSGSDLRLPDDDEVLGIVESMLGANRLKVRCMDGETRTARIPGRMKKRVWINEEDVVIVEPWDWQDEKADVKWRYDSQEADRLREEGYL